MLSWRYIDSDVDQSPSRGFHYIVHCPGRFVAARRKRSVKAGKEWKDVLDNSVQRRDTFWVD